MPIRKKVLVSLFFHPDHAFFKLKPGQHYYPATTLAFDFYIRPHAGNLPVETPTGMLFFHSDNIPQAKALSFHTSLLP
jgi:hypothetical protein